MKNTAYNDPKDEHITNDDNAVTNKDGDNDLEKGQPPSPLKVEQTEEADDTPQPPEGGAMASPRK